MKKLWILSIALLLSACGGSSDSSGSGQNNSSSEDIYEIRFRSLPNCVVDETNKIIYAAKNDGPTSPIAVPGIPNRITEECKVKRSNINGGLTFSLKCLSVGSTFISVYAEKSHMTALQEMLRTGKPYQVTCDR